MAQAANRTDDNKTGKSVPVTSGEVADEDVNDIFDAHDKKRKGGQDHSTEDYGETMPDSGVGAVQDASDTTSDVARIKE